jgi:hypothetical protein
MTKKSSKGSRGNTATVGIVDDDRFSSMHNNPIFRKTKKDKMKLDVDERFEKVLTDDRFHALPGGSVDAYGRRVRKQSQANENELSAIYRKGESSDGKDDKSKNSEAKKKTNLQKTKSDPLESRLDYLNRLARGEISGPDSETDSDRSSDDEGSISDNGDNDDTNGDDGDLENDVVDARSGKYRGPLAIPNVKEEDDEEEESELNDGYSTSRLAVQNCEWESVKSVDIL